MSKFIEFWLGHLSAPLGRHMTQTYWDACPGPTLLRLGIEAGEPRGQLLDLAKAYVAFNKNRPMKMYQETVVDGVKMGGYDHGHFVMSYYADIVDIFTEDEQLQTEAASLMFKHMLTYAAQEGSYLSNPKGQKYGLTGRCRISAMIVRSLADAYVACHRMGQHGIAQSALGLLGDHLKNIYSLISNDLMHDGPQGDGLMMDHYRVFQSSMLAHALTYVAEKVTNHTDIYDMVAILTAIAAMSVKRDINGGVVGFWYDVPKPLGAPQPWPGSAKLGAGNGTELWSYKWLPPDAKAVIRAVNPGLHPAVKAKFYME